VWIIIVNDCVILKAFEKWKNIVNTNYIVLNVFFNILFDYIHSKLIQMFP
jgi:hypothetical protein